MDRKTLVMFDDDSTAARHVFNNNWEIENRVITQTATEENLISVERTDTGSSSVYIGDQKEIQQCVEANGGIYFSSANFIAVNQAMISLTITSDFKQHTNAVDKIESPRRTVSKIKKLNSLGIHFKILKNDIY